MNDSLSVVLLGLAAAAAVGLGGLTLVRPLRRRSTLSALVAVAVISVAAVLAGVLVAAHEMFLSSHDFSVVALVSVPAGLAAIAVALVLGRQVVAGSRALQQATRALGDGDPFVVPRTPATSDLAALSRELAAASERLAAAGERERALESSRRELVAWVSHDLRTPLAGLRAMAEALEDGVAEDPARYHRQIRVEVDRLSGMVTDLFELSRIHSGTLRLSLERVSLSDLVSDTLAGAYPLARASGVHLSGRTPGSLPVHADSRELSRALTNLVVNAIRHTPSDGSVQILAAEDSGDRGTCVLSVEDRCGGIPADDLERVFDVAWRGTHARTPEPDTGAGLGLAIVRGIVEAHSGTITVSNVAGGCRFEVRLPAAPDAITGAAR